MPLLFLLVGLLFSVGCHKESLGIGSGSSLFLSGERPQAFFGSTGDLVGDLNGDGFADIVIGAPGDSRNGTDSGSIYVYFGSAAGPSKTPSGLLTGRAGDRFGTSVA